MHNFMRSEMVGPNKVREVYLGTDSADRDRDVGS